MPRTDDPIADFNRHSARQERQLRRFPRCGYCRDYIQDGYFYEINDVCVCWDCLNENHRKSVDDYIE